MGEQIDLFASATTGGALIIQAPPVDIFARYGLPREGRDELGRLTCRYHGAPILRSGMPCPACWAEARGMFGPIVDTAGNEVLHGT